jgi:hypothetical protein
VTGLGSLDVTKLVNAWLAASVAPDFTMEGLVSKTSSGQTGTSTLTLTPQNGFTGTVNLTCAPDNTSVQISCTLNPTSVDLSGTAVATAQLSIATAAALEPPSEFRFGPWLAGSAGFFAIVLLGGVPRKRTWTLLSGILSIALLVSAVACGGGSSSTQKQQSHGTPAGKYTVTVTGTNGSITHTTSVSLTVQ